MMTKKYSYFSGTKRLLILLKTNSFQDLTKWKMFAQTQLHGWLNCNQDNNDESSESSAKYIYSSF